MTTRLDALGLDMSTSEAAIPHWDAVVVGALSHAKATPDALGKLLAADPTNVLAHAAKALFLVLLARPEMNAAARDAASAAADHFAHRGGTAREGRYVAAAIGGRPSPRSRRSSMMTPRTASRPRCRTPSASCSATSGACGARSRT
jgi:hypothetical protein